MLGILLVLLVAFMLFAEMCKPPFISQSDMDAMEEDQELHPENWTSKKANKP